MSTLLNRIFLPLLHFAAPNRVLSIDIVRGEQNVVIKKTKGEVAQKFSSLSDAADELQRRLTDSGECVSVVAAAPSAAPLRIIVAPPLSEEHDRTLKQSIAPASLVVVCISPLKDEKIKTKEECEGECDEILKRLTLTEKSVSKCIFVITQLDKAMALVDERYSVLRNTVCRHTDNRSSIDLPSLFYPSLFLSPCALLQWPSCVLMTCRSDKLQVALKGLTAKLSGKHVFAIGGDDSTLDGRITNAGLVQMYALLLPFLSSSSLLLHYLSKFFGVVDGFFDDGVIASTVLIAVA